MPSLYTQCENCNGWLCLDKAHITGEVQGRKVHIHDDACLRILQHKVPITNIKRVSDQSSFPVMG